MKLHPLDLWRRKQKGIDGKPLRWYRIAEMLGCSPARLTQIVQDGQMPSMDLAARIKKLTGISADRLMSAGRLHEDPTEEILRSLKETKKKSAEYV